MAQPDANNLEELRNFVPALWDPQRCGVCGQYFDKHGLRGGCPSKCGGCFACEPEKNPKPRENLWHCKGDGGSTRPLADA